MSTSSLRGWLFLAAALAAAAWVTLGLVFERYSTHTRYSGYGIFAILYLGALPAAALGAAILHWLFPRLATLWSVLGFGSAILIVGYALLAVVSGEWHRAHRKQEEAKASAAAEATRARIEAELDGMTFEQQLTELADNRRLLADQIAARLLEDGALWAPTRAPDAATPEAQATLARVVTALAHHYYYAISALAPKLYKTPPPLRARLVTAMLTGLAARQGPDVRIEIVRQLLELEPSGAWLREGLPLFKLTANEQAEAAHSLLADGSDKARAALLVLLSLGVTTRAEFHRRTVAEAFRDGFDAELWPTQIEPRDLSFYEALRKAEPTP